MQVRRTQSQRVSPTSNGSHPISFARTDVRAVAPNPNFNSTGERKKSHWANIFLASKTDNQDVSQRDPFHHKTTLPPEDESYASFLRLIDEIGRWLRSGYSVKGVWLASTRGTPATESLRPPTETKPAPKVPIRSMRLTHRLATADGQGTGVRSKDGGVQVKTALNQTSRSESTVPRGLVAAGATSQPFRRCVGERSRSDLTSRWFGRFQQSES